MNCSPGRLPELKLHVLKSGKHTCARHLKTLSTLKVLIGEAPKIRPCQVTGRWQVLLGLHLLATIQWQWLGEVWTSRVTVCIMLLYVNYGASVVGSLAAHRVDNLDGALGKTAQLISS